MPNIFGSTEEGISRRLNFIGKEFKVIDSSLKNYKPLFHTLNISHNSEFNTFSALFKENTSNKHTLCMVIHDGIRPVADSSFVTYTMALPLVIKGFCNELANRGINFPYTINENSPSNLVIKAICPGKIIKNPSVDKSITLAVEFRDNRLSIFKKLGFCEIYMPNTEQFENIFPVKDYRRVYGQNRTTLDYAVMDHLGRSRNNNSVIQNYFCNAKRHITGRYMINGNRELDLFITELKDSIVPSFKFVTDTDYNKTSIELFNTSKGLAVPVNLAKYNYYVQARGSVFDKFNKVSSLTRYNHLPARDLVPIDYSKFIFRPINVTCDYVSIKFDAILSKIFDYIKSNTE